MLTSLERLIASNEAELEESLEYVHIGAVIRMVKSKADAVLEAFNVNTTDLIEARTMYLRIFECEGCINRVIEDQRELDFYDRNQVPEGMRDLEVPRGDLLHKFRDVKFLFRDD